MRQYWQIICIYIVFLWFEYSPRSTTVNIIEFSKTKFIVLKNKCEIQCNTVTASLENQISDLNPVFIVIICNFRGRFITTFYFEIQAVISDSYRAFGRFGMNIILFLLIYFYLSYVDEITSKIQKKKKK